MLILLGSLLMNLFPLSDLNAFLFLFSTILDFVLDFVSCSNLHVKFSLLYTVFKINIVSVTRSNYS